LVRIKEEKLQKKRVLLLTEYVEDAADRVLHTMDDDVWDAYFNTKKKAHLDKIRAEEERVQAIADAKIKREKEDEEKRLADIETSRLEKIEHAKQLAKIEREAEIEILRQKAESEKKLEDANAKADKEAKIKLIDFQIAQRKAEKEHEANALERANKAVTDEIARVAMEKKKEVDAENKRMKNAKHNQAINKAAKEALMDQLHIDADMATKIVLAIKAETIPSIFIKY